MLLISSDIIPTRNLPTVIICNSAWGRILLFNGMGSCPLIKQEGWHSFPHKMCFFTRQESRCAVSVLQVSAHQECCGNLCECWKAFELGALLDKRDSPLEGLAAFMLLMAPFSRWEIYSGCLGLLPGGGKYFHCDSKSRKVTSVGMPEGLGDCLSFSIWGGFIWWPSAGPSLGTSSRVTYALWYIQGSALCPKVQEETSTRIMRVEWWRAGLIFLPQMHLEFIMIQQPGGDVKNCLGKVKGKGK